MHIGLTMEREHWPNLTHKDAFQEAFMMAAKVDNPGWSGVWLAERHFATSTGTRGVPSIVSAPMILATAIGERTEKIRVGIGVLVLPLGHAYRMAEEVASLDNICHGRFDQGIPPC